MTSSAPPQVLQRSLTFRFAKSVSSITGLPDLMEVAVLPLGAGSIGGQATYAGGLKTATVELSDPVNAVSFDLIPSDSPGLSTRITYRVMWRTGLTGRTFTTDFAMPDADLDWDELIVGVGNVIDGQTYLQQSDLGVPGRVARLNDAGHVIDALGNEVPTGADVNLMRSDLNVEILNRTRADLSQRAAMESEWALQIDATLNTAQVYTDNKTATLNGQVAAEASVRTATDASLHTQIETAKTDLQLEIDSLTATDVGAIPLGSSITLDHVTGLIGQLAGKTDTTTTTALQNQVTALAGDATVVHTVASLVPNAVMPANIALVNANGNIINKSGVVVALGTGAAVTSINGRTGAVVQDLSDIAALGGSVPSGQVDGLVAALGTKVNVSDTRLTNARTPTAHAGSHGVGQTDAITVDPSQVTGLLSIITNNALTGSSLHESRIAALESGAGGSGGTPAKSLWFNEAVDHTGVTLPSEFQSVHGVTLRGPWSTDGAGSYSYNADGVPPVGETYLYPYVSPNGHLELREWNEGNPADPTYATTTQLGTKADSSSVSALSTTVDTKADASALTTTNGNVSALQATMPTKADLSSGRVPNAQMSNTLPISSVAALSAYLVHLNATTGAFDAAFLGNWAGVTAGAIDASKVAGLTAALPTKADLSGGYLATAQIPPQVISNAVLVANRAAMLALSTSVAHQGTLCQITATADAGTYFLTNNDPTQFANWLLITSQATGSISSVNGYFGPNIVLNYTDVGAMAVNAVIGINQVSTLQTALDAKATSAALTSGLAGKTSPLDLQNMFYLSGLIKRADYVATSPVASLAGQQSADGVIAPVGGIILLTAQSSSVQNGLWIVSNSAWTRPANFATGSYLARDSIIIIGNTTANANGTTNNGTIWQMSTTSGFIDTNLSSWTRIGYSTVPMAPVEGNGIAITGTYPAKAFAAKTVSGGGILATAPGLSIDRNLTPGKFLGTVPSGSPICGITHNLNCLSPAVFIYEVASGNLVLAGVTITSPNALSVEFASAPATNQYRIACYG